MASYEMLPLCSMFLNMTDLLLYLLSSGEWTEPNNCMFSIS